MSAVDVFRRRVPGDAPRAHTASFGWRWLFPAVMVVMAVAIPVLARIGADAVLDSNTGRSVEGVTDPSAPGYLAAVVQTSVGVALAVDTDQSLVGLTVLASAPEGGGTVIVVPLPFVDPDTSEQPLADVFATDGEDAVVEIVEAVLGVGVTDVVTFGPEFWNDLVALIGELEVDLTRGAGPGHPSGPNVLEPSEVFDVYAYTDPDETAHLSAIRQGDIWGAYLDAAAAFADPAEVLGGLPGGIPEILRALTRGERVVEVLPATLTPPPVELFVVADVDEIAVAALVRRAVPFPQPPTAGAWPRVALINGVGDLSLNADILGELVDLGLQVTIVGNSQTLGIAASSVEYSLTEHADVAAAIAENLAIDDVRHVPVDPEAPALSELADIVVTLGLDA